MTESFQIDFSHPLPLFPLPNCVLLPGATIPLHIFEPRYRAMTTDALDSLGLIAMALFEGDQWKLEYEGNPPIRSYVCVGYIVRHEQLDDGRFDLLLQGVCRAKIVKETRHMSYRQAMLEPTDGHPTMEIDLYDQRQHLEAILKDPLLSRLAAVSAVKNNWLNQEMPTATLIDLAFMALCEDPDDRYAMLVESQVMERYHCLEDYLRRTRKTLEIAERFRPPEAPDGFSHN